MDAYRVRREDNLGVDATVHNAAGASRYRLLLQYATGRSPAPRSPKARPSSIIPPVNDPPSNEEQQQSQQEQRSRRDGLPAGWRYYDQAKHRSRLRGWLAQVWRGAKNNAALLSLVGVLLTLLVTTLLTQLEWSHQQKVESQDALQQQKLENQRAEAERELAAQRAQDETLQAYLDQMSNLLMEKSLRDSAEDSEVRTLARVRTLTALETLDPSRKTAVVQFLVEDGLVQRVYGRDPIIGLSGADLRGVALRGADLRGADLSEADLRGANLRGANLRGANLRNADLSEANLYHANLSEANVSEANLSGADLSVAFDITNEELEQQAASLEEATMPDGSIHY